MLSIGDGYFIETSTQSSSRILHPAKLLGNKDGCYTAEIGAARLSLVEGAEFQLYFMPKQEFMKQAARIEAVSSDEPTPTIEFTTVGEPVSAENRQHFRVSTVMSGLTATLGKQTDCKLLNVSTVGFCVLATASYDIGSTVNASVTFEGKTYSGRGCVQSIRTMSKGEIRYGLHCIDMNGSGGMLEMGMRKITTTIQRHQLRRLASVD